MVCGPPGLRLHPVCKPAELTSGPMEGLAQTQHQNMEAKSVWGVRQTSKVALLSLTAAI